MFKGVTLGVKWLKVTTTLYDSSLDSGSDMVKKLQPRYMTQGLTLRVKLMVKTLQPRCMTQGLTLGVKWLKDGTTLYDSKFDSGSEMVKS